MAAIMGGIGEIKPEGRNPHFSYSFIKDTQISGLFRARFAQYGIVLIPDVIEESIRERSTKTGTSYVTVLKVLFTLVDSETGETLSGHGIGYGDDPADKGANKAFTAAEKYWLMKTFQIGGEDDAESDAATDKRYAETDEASQGRAVTVQTSSLTKPVGKGGHQTVATQAQVVEIASEMARLNLSFSELNSIIEATVGRGVELPEDSADQPAAMRSFISALEGAEAGKIIETLNSVESKLSSDDEQ
jgi:hypothetical protein